MVMPTFEMNLIIIFVVYSQSVVQSSCAQRINEKEKKKLGLYTKIIYMSNQIHSDKTPLQHHSLLMIPYYHYLCFNFCDKQQQHICIDSAANVILNKSTDFMTKKLKEIKTTRKIRKK